MQHELSPPSALDLPGKGKYKNGLLPMVLINFAIGSVYCWTLFKEYIWAYTGFSRAVTEWCFSLAIFFLGISAAFGGRIVEKNPRKSAFLTFIFFTTGWLVTGLGIQLRSAVITILGFGVIQGIGLGLGYITPIKTLMIWFKDRPGLAAGLTIASFGLAGVIANPLIAVLLENIPVFSTFYLLAIIYGIALFIGSRLLYRPHVDYGTATAANLNFREVIFSTKFILLWLVFFLNITAGLALISQERQIYGLLNYDNRPLMILFITISALGNVAGRLVMAGLQDRTDTKHAPYFVMVIGSALAIMVAAIFPHNYAIFLGLLVVIQFFFGTGFSCMPNILQQNWGLRHLSTVHGLILSAWAFAGLVGNQLANAVIYTYSPQTLYFILLGFFVIELLLLFAWTVARKRSAEHVEELAPQLSV